MEACRVIETGCSLVLLCPTRSMVAGAYDTHIGGTCVTPFRRESNFAAPDLRHAIQIVHQQEDSIMAKKITKDKKRRPQKEDPNLALIHPNAAGIDIGSAEHYVAVPEGRDTDSVRSFQSFTQNLHELASWLKACGIETVAMESTGVYWIPLYDLLTEKGFEVHLVNARHLKNVSGRNKTDVLDCQWIQRLHTFGLLTGSFRPEKTICQLRAYHRHREMLVSEAAKHILHMQKALSQMNVQLHNVISDVTGVTGMKIIRAIIGGERDPKKLAQFRHGGCKNSVDTIEKSLAGYYQSEHLFSLKQSVELYDVYQQKIRDCDVEIEKLLQSFEDQSGNQPAPEEANKQKNKNAPKFDLHSHLFRMTGVDLTRVPGLSSHSVFKIVSEVGLDMSCWKNEKQFASWLGLSPGNKISGGKRLSGRSLPTKNRAAEAFRVAANTLYHSKSALGAYHRRMKGRLGAPKAVTATAHKIARIFYRLLKYGETYVERGQDYYEKAYKKRVTKNLERRAKALGFELVALQATT